MVQLGYQIRYKGETATLKEIKCLGCEAYVFQTDSSKKWVCFFDRVPSVDQYASQEQLPPLARLDNNQYLTNARLVMLWHEAYKQSVQ